MSLNSLMYILDMKIEWARARSCALRWDEEKQLLPEEMRCVVTTHLAMQDRWLSRLNARSDVPMDVFRGLDAYVHRQADIHRSLALSFVKLWSPEMQKNEISVDWPPELAEHAATVDPLPERKSGRKKAKAAYISDSEGEGDTIGGEDAIGQDGDESGLLHLTSYTDSENSEKDENSEEDEISDELLQ